MNIVPFLMFDLNPINLLSLKVMTIKHFINYLKKPLYMQSIILILWTWVGKNCGGIKKLITS
ncbi:MAG: hypothetical protein AMJ42_02425 [Deltaproteobacteria bacterium DG_8]|nr:MAG: hypothetical protein AMJ42_02425 [Deltaproteobacteria bacterium DG_8]